jgi:hypothetical protein
MTDDPTPTLRFDPTWAFGAAAISLACALVGCHLVSTVAAHSVLAEIATGLAAIVLPGWLAVGVVLATVPANGVWPSPRARALTILAAIVLTLPVLVSIALLFWLASHAVGIAFAVACGLALAFLDRALAARG